MGQLSVLCVTVVKEVEHLTDSGSSSVRPIPQASVVPYRQLGDATEVCLITSRRKKRWIFPKGTALERTGLIESALKAAMEEAGLIGQVTGETLGCYKRLKEGVLNEVSVFLMEVERTEAAWLDQGLRQRRWVPLDEARRLLVKPELQDMRGRAIMRIGESSSATK